jgi:hypothetical protein
MFVPPAVIIPAAVIIHGLADASAALAPGLPVTLLSAPGAALYAGCGWWQALIRLARSQHPAVPATDILDCADGSGQAMAALRIGLPRLVLWPSAPGRAAVAAIAEAQGGYLLATPPPALDLGQRGAARRLPAWLQVRSATGDKDGGLS